MKEYNVFISYSRKDDINFPNPTGKPSAIDLILKHLEKGNIKYWIDREGKYCGSSFQTEIVKAIENSESVLFISSVNSNDAIWVEREINYADSLKIKIFPLLLDNTHFNPAIRLIFNRKDHIEYYKNPTKGLSKLIENINKYIEDIKRQEEDAKQELAKRKKLEEEEKEKRRIETEEKIRIEKLEREITDIKKRIIEYANKQQACMIDLLSKEKDLNKPEKSNNYCPICQTTITDIKAGYCDICGWHFSTPKELMSIDMQQFHEERINVSKTIWTQKQQREKEIETLKIRNKQLSYETIKLQEDVNKANLRLTEAQKKIAELSKKEENPILTETGNTPIAFLLVTEHYQTNVYCLFKGRNIFGAMQAKANDSEYQMLVVSDNNLNSRHFEINIKKEERRLLYSIMPINEDCILSLNSEQNIIKAETNIRINDLLFIGKVKIQIIDNFNKII